MTDKDIIKALECDTYTDCRECPHIEEDCYKNSQVSAKDILDLINRQQKDKEKLQKNILKYEEIFVKQQTEIKRLQNKCEDCAGCTSWKCDCANIKSEAIKEFAERLKKPNRWREEDIYYIDTLVEEMVGEE